MFQIWYIVYGNEESFSAAEILFYQRLNTLYHAAVMGKFIRLSWGENSIRQAVVPSDSSHNGATSAMEHTHPHTQFLSIYDPIPSILTLPNVNHLRVVHSNM